MLKTRTRSLLQRTPGAEPAPPLSAPLRSRMTRRFMLASVPGAMLTIAGVSCGGDDDDAVTPAPLAATATAPATTATMAPIGTAATGAAWSFTDDRGVTTSLPAMPQRIAAQTSAAAALWDCGVRPVAIFGPRYSLDGTPDFSVGNMDLDAVEWLGDYGEMDIEKLIALDVDVFVDMAFDDTEMFYLNPELLPRIEELMPVIGISMGRVSILDSITRFEDLSVLVGADPNHPELVAAKDAFTIAEDNLRAAIAAKPDLTVWVVSPSIEALGVASSDWMTDLNYFRTLGLEVLDNDADYFFGDISWEEVGNYPADVILVDARGISEPGEGLEEITVWTNLPAVQADQLGFWYAGAPYSRARLIPIMEELTDLIERSRDDLV